MGKKSSIRGGRKERVTGLVAGFCINLYSALLRYRFIDQTELLSEGSELKDGVIFAVWHNRILGLFRIWKKVHSFRESNDLVVLTSASKDGAMIEAAVGVNGIRAIRGSSSRRGRMAMVQMLRELDDKHSMCITPDGPRGPVYQLNAGVIRLAQKSKKPIVIVKVKYARYWELKTWDRFQIPMPLTRVTVVFETVVYVPDELENEEEWRERVESQLNSTTID